MVLCQGGKSGHIQQPWKLHLGYSSFPNNNKRVRTAGVCVLLPFQSKVHLSPTSPYALSKYHIIQFTGIALIAKYPLGSQEMPRINCLVRAPLGYHQGSTLSA